MKKDAQPLRIVASFHVNCYGTRLGPHRWYRNIQIQIPRQRMRFIACRGTHKWIGLQCLQLKYEIDKLLQFIISLQSRMRTDRSNKPHGDCHDERAYADRWPALAVLWEWRPRWSPRCVFKPSSACSPNQIYPANCNNMPWQTIRCRPDLIRW